MYFCIDFHVFYANISYDLLIHPHLRLYRLNTSKKVL